MMKRDRLVATLGYVAVIALIAVTTNGCTSATHIALVRDQAPISATTVKILVPQDEVYAKVNQSNVSAATGGGLLFALVDVAITNSRSKTAEQNIAPLRQALSDLDVRHEVSQRLEPALQDASWLHIQGVTTSQERIPPSKRGEIAKSLGPGMLLLIETDYALSTDLRVLGVTTSVEMRNPTSDKPVYLARFLSISDPVASETDGTVAAWAGDNGAAFRKALNQGLDEVVTMLKLDLLAETSDGAGNGPVVDLTYSDPQTGRSTQIEGPVLHRDGTRAIIRGNDGNLVALTN